MHTITLDKPIKRKDKDIKELELREPNGAGEMRGLRLINVQDLDIDTILLLTQRLLMTPLTREEIDMIGLPDLVKIGHVIVGFFSASPDQSQTTR